MNRLSVELVQSKLIEADEVKKTTAAKLNLRNKGKKEIKNPTAAVERSKRSDTITQIVQDPKFNVDVAPKNNKELFPQADYAETYTDSMPHGQTAGMGKGENQKSPKITSAKGSTPNQTTKLKQVGDQWGKVAKTEDDGNQNVFTIPQADYAEKYTDSMPHGSKNVDFNTENKGEPGKRSYDKMAGGPTRAGGKRNAKTGDNTVGAKDKDSQKVTQVTGPGKETAPSDAMKWGSADYKKETHGATNVVESGVLVTLNGKKKAAFEVVSHNVLQKMAENYKKHGYTVEFSRQDNVAWKKDRRFLDLMRESIHASHNHAPKIAEAYRKAAMQRFGKLCRNSYNPLYESRQAFANVMGTAFKKIETLAENKYLDRLEFFDCSARLRVDEDIVDLEVITQATDKMMAARQVRNKIQEEYGFGVDLVQIFIDGQKIPAKKIAEYRPTVSLKKKV